MLSTPEDGVTIPAELQKKLDTARANVSLAEQDFIRLRGLAQDQEAVVRSMLEKQEQLKAETASFQATLETLKTDVDLLSAKKSELTADVGSLGRVLVAKNEEKEALTEETDALTAEIANQKKKIADERAKHEQYLRDTEKIAIEKTEAANARDEETRTRKEKLLKALSEI